MTISKASKHVLLISDSYPPEVRSASQLMLELARALRQRGHRVSVVTCMPQYNLDEATRTDDYQKVMIEDDGIRVIRVNTPPHHKVNYWVRGVAQVVMPAQFLAAIRRHIGEAPDVVLVYSPPLPLAEVGIWCSKLFHARFVLNVQDVFPQNAIDLGVLKNQRIINAFQWLERRAYRLADHIMVHSGGNLEFLQQQKNVPREKLSVVHNWIDLAPHQQATRANCYREKLGLVDKFVLLFAGVMGPSQKLDDVIRVARRVQNIEDFVLLLVGDGTERDRLEAMVAEHKLKNVIFHPFVSAQEYVHLVKEADLGLVSLSSDNQTPVVPGKILGYMAGGVPVLAYLHQASDGHQIIRDARCGHTCVSGDVERMTALLKKVMSRRGELGQMGEAGRAYVTEHFAKDTCVDMIEDLL